MNFSQLGLAPAQVRSCESLGYTEPTQIQVQAIPVILSGKDLIGCAETGTGKTAAFLLPIIQTIAESQRPGVRVRPSVVIATPGRLLDLMERRNVDLSFVEVLVLDEADRMLDMGFLPAIRQVLAALPTKRQTLLFSATMSSEIEKLARSTMQQPKLIEVSPRGQAAIMVEQTAYPVSAESKTALLLDLLERERFERVLVFTRTRRGAERLSHILEARDHKVNRIHSDRSQPQREAALSGFRDGRTRVLVATDIAARGLDVDSVSHVINYDVPAVPEDYVHRIGRTGRAGNVGQAITIVAPVDELSMRAIERLTGQEVKRVVLPGFGGAQPLAAPGKTFARFARSGRSSSVRSFRPRRAR